MSLSHGRVDITHHRHVKSWEIDNRIYLGAGAAVLTLAGCAELGLYRWSSAWEWLRSARWEALLLFSGGTVLLLVAARHAGRPASEASATPVAATPSGHHDRWNSPSSLTAAVTAAAAIAALVFTGQQSRAARESVEATREQLRLTRLGQVRQRYSQAIDQLGAQGIDARTGGIYALERIMRESSTDQDIIVDILAAFVRNHRPLQSVIDSSIVPGDVQAALTVLGRRPTDYAIDGYPIPRWDPAGRTLNLSYTDLTGANLTRAKLAFADLTGSNLQGADLTLAQLTGAKLFKARLAKADLSGESKQ